jgi:peptide chain release factor 2
LRLDELNSLSEDPKLWDNAEKAQAIMGERNKLAAAIDRQKALEQAVEDALGLAELAEEEGDEATVDEVQRDLERIKEQVDRLQLESMLSGEADANDAFLQVAAGAGGTESQDWAQMLLRMYLRWAEQHGYKVEWIEESEGEEAGIKSATIKIQGENAYGWLKTESGVHRLVRISPFDSNARRHTSFASVSVSPVIDDRIQIEILDKDLKVDTYRASGAGGQHVNRTDSAVRLTHLPTGIVVACQNDRSQHRNRAQAMDMLRAKLYEQEIQKRRAASDALEAQKMDTSFGSQIRNYVLHPYKLVKDLRTSVESGNPQAVLDGDLDRFLEASLAQGATQRRPEA